MKRLGLKRLLTFVMAAVLIFSFTNSVQPASADTMNNLKAEQERLRREKSALEKSIKDSEGAVEKLGEYLDYYDRRMKVQEREIEVIQQQIELFSQNIEELQEAIIIRQGEVDAGIELFRRRLRELYISGNDNLASVLAGSADFYDMLVRMELFERISKHDKEVLDQLNEMIEGLEADKVALEEALTAEEQARAEAERSLRELKATYDGHAETKRMREAEIEDYRNRGDELEAEEKKVEQQIQAEIKRQQEEAERRRKEEEERRRREEEERKKAAEAAGEEYVEQDTRIFASFSDTGFIWPAPTVRNMSDGYGNRWIIEEKRNQFHKGVDITKPGCGGEPVVASAGGEVIMAVTGWGGGYGNHVVIDHGNKVSTLYGHCSSITVKTGDIVKQGQTIGYIGNSGNSYGNHLHFEVRENGQHVNPMNYVNMNN
ncbi:MAG: peptidoglycan DD-metalloendopeptidase family protein [Oscillospiraceae bacterium]|nr:peptidoglycan DD-metalloendopeptidase family protein [Oscillospiraceae bacterium]